MRIASGGCTLHRRNARRAVAPTPPVPCSNTRPAHRPRPVPPTPPVPCRNTRPAHRPVPRSTAPCPVAPPVYRAASRCTAQAGSVCRAAPTLCGHAAITPPSLRQHAAIAPPSLRQHAPRLRQRPRTVNPSDRVVPLVHHTPLLPPTPPHGASHALLPRGRAWGFGGAHARLEAQLLRVCGLGGFGFRV